jgi:hypothetical protein
MSTVQPRTKSCDYCRQNRVRCDRIERAPLRCARCQTRDLPCTFLPPQQSRLRVNKSRRACQHEEISGHGADLARNSPHDSSRLAAECTEASDAAEQPFQLNLYSGPDQQIGNVTVTVAKINEGFLYFFTRMHPNLPFLSPDLCIESTLQDPEQQVLVVWFSGGGQFVHRFAYLHPDRLHALVCGAPGTHTRIDYMKNYPLGVKDFESIFDRPVQWEVLRTVPTMFIVGDEDTDTSYLSVRGYQVDAENKDGRYRAIMLWEAAWKQAGGNSCFVAVSCAKHEDVKMWPSVEDFFSRHLPTLVDPAPSLAP